MCFEFVRPACLSVSLALFAFELVRLSPTSANYAVVPVAGLSLPSHLPRHGAALSAKRRSRKRIDLESEDEDRSVNQEST